MLKALADLFRPSEAAPSPEERERGLRLAAAALLFEVVRADGVVKPEEQTVLRTALRSTFAIGEDELDELVQAGERGSREAISLYEFTRQVDEALSQDEKKRIVELLWLVSFADGVKAAEEEHVVRRIAGLLHVTHPEFIDAKLRARAAAEQGAVPENRGEQP
jgi:uncharacterized tellurite resistance protein B-like protein